MLLLPALAPSALARDVTCSQVLSPNSLPLNPPENGVAARLPLNALDNLVVSTPCMVNPGTYYFGAVNVIKGGTLTFKEGANSLDEKDKKTTLWASSIIIENGGAMKAGVDGDAAYGTNGGELTIVLYGPDQTGGKPGTPAAGALCVSPPYQRGVKSTNSIVPDCGIPDTDVWATNGGKPVALTNDAPGGGPVITDRFYKYGALHGDDGLTDGRVGHFGNKVLALSYGGTLQLRGFKGSMLSGPELATDSGRSWVRLAVDVLPGKGGNEIKLSQQVANNMRRITGANSSSGAATSTFGDWKKGDKIVITTTDYVPDHSEELTIDKIAEDGKTITLTTPVQYPHNGNVFDVARALGSDAANRLPNMDSNLKKSAETRAAVALLTRSIRIISGGDRAGETFDDATNGNIARFIPKNPNYAFGGQVVFRQGFARLQIQGVEFHQLGEGGRMGHYSVHFHEARDVPHSPGNTTTIKDSSVSESMTRWFVIHDTNYVELWRNVGWKSIGHGYYFEDGTEANNKLYSNIGVLARAAVAGPDNPRGIPGILAQNGAAATAGKPAIPNYDATMYRSDIMHPTVFWITNAWNELVGNMAAGAGTCGSCFWYVPVTNTDMMDVPSLTPLRPSTSPPGPPAAMTPMTWTGYSAEQARGSPAGPGSTPVKLFYGNYCSSAMHSLNTVGAASPCNGVDSLAEAQPKPPAPGMPFTDIRWKIQPLRNPFAPQPDMTSASPMARLQMYYPDVTSSRQPTVCNPGDANGDPACSTTPRCNNKDPKTCATTIIDHYTTSFNWAETNFSAVWLRSGWNFFDNGFISDVQNGGITLVSGGDYSRSSAPLGYWALASNSIFVGQTQDKSKEFSRPEGPCAALNCVARAADTRVAIQHSVAYPLSNWATNQRFFNIYDGPAHQDSNAYLDIRPTDCNDARSCMYFGTPGVRRYPGPQGSAPKGYLPNAAIGWKQPNGFYYPPAFGSRNLVFENVGIRHYVVSPLTERGTYLTDDDLVSSNLIGIPPKLAGLYTGYTDIDRQTVLNDEDGSLTGFKKTISVNDDPMKIVGNTISKPPGGFFGAQIQASECASNVGVTPANACGNSSPPPKTAPTTRTSPYDYLTTVIYPGCATRNENGGNFVDTACGSSNRTEPASNVGNKTGARFAKEVGRGGTWSRDCAGPFCTGVQLYRQDLTDGDWGTPTSKREWQTWEASACSSVTARTDAKFAECDFPFIRMSGASEWQRDTLTVNGGVYYIDTTRSLAAQRKDPALGRADVVTDNYVECDVKTVSGDCSPHSVNVFEPGKTYYVFFLFAKQDKTRDMKQTYQIYVGDGFNADNDVKGVRVKDTEIAFLMDTTSWTLPKGWTREMISSRPGAPKDILEVTVDFNAAGVPDLNPKSASSGLCKPSSFCEGTGASCGCSLDTTKDPWLKISPTLIDACKNACKTWAVADLDCPTDGCIGFSFTLPKDGFEADNQYKRPTPHSVIADKTAPWDVPFKSAAPASRAGNCKYTTAQTPGQPGCPVPN